jgi:hypothetical protein
LNFYIFGINQVEIKKSDNFCSLQICRFTELLRGSSVVDGQIFFYGFGSRNFFCQIRIRRLIFCHDNILKSGSQIMYSGTCKTEKKFCYIKKHSFCSFKCSTSYFLNFLLNFKQYRYLDPNPNFFFGFGQHLWILSDSDPQHCAEVMTSRVMRYLRVRIIVLEIWGLWVSGIVRRRILW